MPTNNLRSVAAQCRNFSTGWSRGNLSSSLCSHVSRVVSMGSMCLIGVAGVTIGMSVGYLFVGDTVGRFEKARQKGMRETFWWRFDEFEDLRPKMWHELKEMTMWHELKEMTWFQNLERMRSQKIESMRSDIKKKIIDYLTDPES